VNKNCIGGGIPSGAGIITTPANAYYVRFTITDDKIAGFALNYPSTDTSYHAYNGNTTIFTFGTSIYQGSIDWLKGVVLGLWTIKKLSDYSWELISSGESPYFRTTVPDYKYRSSNLNVLAEIYQQATVGATGSDEGFNIISINQLRIRDLRYNDANAFVNGVGNVQLAYELATPIEIPLGGVNLLTQQGVNNIYCDTGNTTLEYIKAGR
jgi:hypothetical protein